jgi:hypothetical protein
VLHTYNPSTHGRGRLQNHRLKTSLEYIAKPCLKKKPKNETKQNKKPWKNSNELSHGPGSPRVDVASSNATMSLSSFWLYFLLTSVFPQTPLRHLLFSQLIKPERSSRQALVHMLEASARPRNQ